LQALDASDVGQAPASASASDVSSLPPAQSLAAVQTSGPKLSTGGSKVPVLPKSVADQHAQGTEPVPTPALRRKASRKPSRLSLPALNVTRDPEEDGKRGREEDSRKEDGAGEAKPFLQVDVAVEGGMYYYEEDLQERNVGFKRREMDVDEDAFLHVDKPRTGASMFQTPKFSRALSRPAFSAPRFLEDAESPTLILEGGIPPSIPTTPASPTREIGVKLAQSPSLTRPQSGSNTDGPGTKRIARSTRQVLRQRETKKTGARNAPEEEEDETKAWVPYYLTPRTKQAFVLHRRRMKKVRARAHTHTHILVGTTRTPLGSSLSFSFSSSSSSFSLSPSPARERARARALSHSTNGVAQVFVFEDKGPGDASLYLLEPRRKVSKAVLAAGLPIREPVCSSTDPNLFGAKSRAEQATRNVPHDVALRIAVASKNELPEEIRVELELSMFKELLGKSPSRTCQICFRVDFSERWTCRKCADLNVPFVLCTQCYGGLCEGIIPHFPGDREHVFTEVETETVLTISPSELIAKRKSRKSTAIARSGSSSPDDESRAETSDANSPSQLSEFWQPLPEEEELQGPPPNGGVRISSSHKKVRLVENAEYLGQRRQEMQTAAAEHVNAAVDGPSQARQGARKVAQEAEIEQIDGDEDEDALRRSELHSRPSEGTAHACIGLSFSVQASAGNIFYVGYCIPLFVALCAT